MFIFKLPSHKHFVSWRFFIKDKLIWIYFLFSALINFLIWLLLFFKMPRSQELVPLHYNIYFGVDKFGRWYEVFLLSVVGLIILLINFAAAYILYKKYKFLSYFLLIFNMINQLILFMAATIIVLLNL